MQKYQIFDAMCECGTEKADSLYNDCKYEEAKIELSRPKIGLHKKVKKWIKKVNLFQD